MQPEAAIALHAAISRETCLAVRSEIRVAGSFAETGTTRPSSSGRLLLGDYASSTASPASFSRERQYLEGSCMLRAATDAILAQRLQQVKYLEGRLAALEAVRRKSTRKNVAFWAEALRGAGRDFALLQENANIIQQAWRAHSCRQKLRHALMSVIKCSACGNRAQVPRKTTSQPPFFNLAPKFRCAVCQSIVVTALHPLWVDFLGPHALYIDSVERTASNSESVIGDKRRQSTAAPDLKARLGQALSGAGLAPEEFAAVEAKLLTFTEFWQPHNVEDMISGSPLLLARGVNIRTGIQLNERTVKLKRRAEKIEEHAALPVVTETGATKEQSKEMTEAAERAREASEKAREQALASFAAASDSRMRSLLTRFKAHASQVGLMRVHRKNLRAAKWQGLTSLVLNQRDIQVAKMKLENELAAEEAKRNTALPQEPRAELNSPTTAEYEEPTVPFKPKAKFPKGALVLAGLPAWGDDKYPGKILIVNGDNTYGVLFDVSLSIAVYNLPRCGHALDWFSFVVFFFASDSVISDVPNT